MLVDGLELIGASNAVNLNIVSGVTLPITGNNVGELFYLTDVGLHVFDGANWILLGGGGGGGDALPAQTGNAGRFLRTDGTEVSWAIPSSGGGGGAAIEPDAITFSYNADGNIASQTETFGIDERVTQYYYNAAGSVTSVVSTYLGVTRTETYTYNANGGVASMSTFNF